jgi:hypothetical protein
MKQKLSLMLMLMTALVNVSAQKIDFDFFGRQSTETTETGYTHWEFPKQVVADTMTVDGITIIVTNSPNSAGTVVGCEWWKNGVQRYSKLVGDCVAASYLNSDDNKTEPTDGYASLRFIIKGLSTGHHTLLAYHNMPFTGTVAPLTIYVNGVAVLTGVPQTMQAQSPSASGQSYISFDAVEGQDVTIDYTATANESDYFSCHRACVNALAFDTTNPKQTALDPSPADENIHVAADDGVCTLSWTPAPGTTKSIIYMGTESGKLSKLAEVTDSFYTVKDLYSMNKYYWRVDEADANGNIITGKEWYFRQRHLAFPGAEGYGRFASGGRGGDVYHVTSLADDEMPGTLRYGLTSATGPRTIVFDVGGVINLKSRLANSNLFITIAGQTAPGNGIMMRTKPFGMASEGITRFMRMRLGGADDWDGLTPNQNTADGMGMTGNNHSIMDHCSISWTIDEAFSSRNAKNITLQRTFISEALNYAGHATQWERQGGPVCHGYAATIGGETGSYHHNLLAHNDGRNWSMGGGLDGSGILSGKLDMFNNVCYNWYDRTTDGGTHEANFVGNYYKMGPDTKLYKLFSMDHEGVGIGTQRAYVHGNIRESYNGTRTGDVRGDTYVSNGSVDYETFVDTAFFESFATIETAEEAFKSVLSDVGCNEPVFDNHDTRIVKEVLNGTTSTKGWHTGYRGIIDKESDSEGFAGLNIYESSRPEGFDTDQDGMPDWWEELKGLDKNTADNNGDPDRDGYTNLEDYLNWMAMPHVTLTPSGKLPLNLKAYFTGYSKNPKFSANSDNAKVNFSISNDTTLIIAATPDYTGITSGTMTVVDSEGSTKTKTIGIAVFGTTGIDELSNSDNEILRREIFSINGVQQGNEPESLQPGVYVIKTIGKHKTTINKFIKK